MTWVGWYSVQPCVNIGHVVAVESPPSCDAPPPSSLPGPVPVSATGAAVSSPPIAASTALPGASIAPAESFGARAPVSAAPGALPCAPLSESPAPDEPAPAPPPIAGSVLLHPIAVATAAASTARAPRDALPMLGGFMIDRVHTAPKAPRRRARFFRFAISDRAKIARVRPGPPRVQESAPSTVLFHRCSVAHLIRLIDDAVVVVDHVLVQPLALLQVERLGVGARGLELLQHAIDLVAKPARAGQE